MTFRPRCLRSSRLRVTIEAEEMRQAVEIRE